MKDNCSWHTSKMQLKSYCAYKQNISARLDIVGVLDEGELKLDNGLNTVLFKLSRDEMIVTQKVLDNFLTEIKEKE